MRTDRHLGAIALDLAYVADGIFLKTLSGGMWLQECCSFRRLVVRLLLMKVSRYARGIKAVWQVILGCTSNYKG